MTYDYRCVACHRQYEVEQKISDPPKTNCRECGVAGSLQRLVSSGNFMLNGSGWAKDGYSKTA